MKPRHTSDPYNCKCQPCVEGAVKRMSMRFNFFPDFNMRFDAGEWVYTSKGAVYDARPFNSLDALLIFLDDKNTEADIWSENIPFREVLIVEVNEDNERVGDFTQYYTYEPYTAAERQSMDQVREHGTL